MNTHKYTAVDEKKSTSVKEQRPNGEIIKHHVHPYLLEILQYKCLSFLHLKGKHLSSGHLKQVRMQHKTSYLPLLAQT
jgi:hypothetical protein